MPYLVSIQLISPIIQLHFPQSQDYNSEVQINFWQLTNQLLLQFQHHSMKDVLIISLKLTRAETRAFKIESTPKYFYLLFCSSTEIILSSVTFPSKESALCLTV